MGLKSSMIPSTYLEHLQAILIKFDPTIAPNKDILISYFQKKLRPSIQAQLDNRGQNLDMWDKIVEKAVNKEAKASIQLLSRTKKIDSRCLRSYWLLDKKNKDDANQKHRDKIFNDKKKFKSHNSSFGNWPQI